MALPAPAQTSLALVFLALAAVRELSWWVRPAAPTAAPAEEAEPLLLEPSATWVATARGLWSSFQLASAAPSSASWLGSSLGSGSAIACSARVLRFASRTRLR